MVQRLGNEYVCRKLGVCTRRFLGELAIYTHEDDHKELKKSLHQLAGDLERQVEVLVVRRA